MKLHINDIVEQAINVKDIDRLCVLGNELIPTKCDWCGKEVERVIVKKCDIGGIYGVPLDHYCRTLKV